MDRILISKTDIEQYKQLPNYLDSNRIDPYIIEAQNFDLKEMLGYPLFFQLMKEYGNENVLITYSNLLISTFTIGEVVSGKISSLVVATGKILIDSSNVLKIVPLTGTWENVETLLGADSHSTANVDLITFGIYYKLLNGEIYTDSQGFEIEYKGIIPSLVYWTYARFIENQNITVTSTGVDYKKTYYSDKVDITDISKRITQARSGALNYFEMVKKYICDKNIFGEVYPYLIHSSENKSGSVRITTINRFASESSSRNDLNRNYHFNK